MKILIHCASGNTDRPKRWTVLNTLLTNLGESLIKLGHDVHMIVHSAAKIPENDETNITCWYSVSKKRQISNRTAYLLSSKINPYHSPLPAI